jgi:hypothetical protein
MTLSAAWDEAAYSTNAAVAAQTRRDINRALRIEMNALTPTPPGGSLTQARSIRNEIMTSDGRSLFCSEMPEPIPIDVKLRSFPGQNSMTGKRTRSRGGERDQGPLVSQCGASRPRYSCAQHYKKEARR